jgi:hypothetical protein
VLLLQMQAPDDVSHVWPVPQGVQAAPAVPHDVGDSEAHA